MDYEEKVEKLEAIKQEIETLRQLQKELEAKKARMTSAHKGSEKGSDGKINDEMDASYFELMRTEALEAKTKVTEQIAKINGMRKEISENVRQEATEQLKMFMSKGAPLTQEEIDEISRKDYYSTVGKRSDELTRVDLENARRHDTLRMLESEQEKSTGKIAELEAQIAETKDIGELAKLNREKADLQADMATRAAAMKQFSSEYKVIEGNDEYKALNELRQSAKTPELSYVIDQPGAMDAALAEYEASLDSQITFMGGKPKVKKETENAMKQYEEVKQLKSQLVEQKEALEKKMASIEKELAEHPEKATELAESKKEVEEKLKQIKEYKKKCDAKIAECEKALGIDSKGKPEDENPKGENPKSEKPEDENPKGEKTEKPLAKIDGYATYLNLGPWNRYKMKRDAYIADKQMQENEKLSLGRKLLLMLPSPTYSDMAVQMLSEGKIKAPEGKAITNETEKPKTMDRPEQWGSLTPEQQAEFNRKVAEIAKQNQAKGDKPKTKTESTIEH